MADLDRSGFARRNSFKRIAADLRARIESGEFGVGRLLPTERELQEEFGVSRSTVRRALSFLIDEGWARLLPNRGVAAASGFGDTRTQNVAFIDGHTFVQRVLSVRMAAMLREEGYHLVHLDATGSVAIEDALEYCVENRFAGAVVWPARGFADPSVLRKLTSAIPTVFLMYRLPGARADFVSFDNVSAGEDATLRLIASGCKRVGVTGMLDMYSSTHDRFTGYLRAMFSAGFQPSASDFCFTYTSAMAKPDGRLLTRRMRDTDAPDGWLVLQDEFVPATIEAAIEAGRRVPQDLKICTVGDDIEINVDGLGMSAVALDWDEMGKVAIDLLLDRIHDPIRDVKTRLASHRMIVRGLCGSAREEWTPDPELLSGFHGNVPFPRSEYRYSSLGPSAVIAEGRDLEAEASSS